jgi:chromosome segregation ATPase
MVLGAITPTLVGAAVKVWATYDTLQTEEIQQACVSAVSFAVLANSAYHLVRSDLKQFGLNLAASAALRMSVEAFKHHILDEKIIGVTTHITSLEDLQKKQEKQIEEKENQIKRQEGLLFTQETKISEQGNLLSKQKEQIDALGEKLNDFDQIHKGGQQLLDEQRTELLKHRAQVKALEDTIEKLACVRDRLIEAQKTLEQKKINAEAEIQQQKTRLARQWEHFETQQTLLSSPQFRVNLSEIRHE